MSRHSRHRGWLGNAAALLVLLLAAGLLLRLHLGADWWLAAPSGGQYRAALVAVLAYAACCLLSLQRRRAEQPDFDNGDGDGDGDAATVLIAWASQTGFARQLAERSAQSLRQGGRRVLLQALEQVDPARLSTTATALFIASTTGEGDAPDHALAFAGRLASQSPDLGGLHYAVLALGDSSYTHYCGFGHQLDQHLRRHGAQPLFDIVEVDNADPGALRHWQQLLGQLGDGSLQTDWSTPDYQAWRLQRRHRLNPGSVGGPVFHLHLQPAEGALPQWQAGDIAEIGPQHAPATVTQWMQAHGIDPLARLADGRALREVLAMSRLPDDADSDDVDALAAALQPLPHREYSIASLPGEGSLQLLLRRQTQANGQPGLGSGWLGEHAAIGDGIRLRLRENRNFHPPAAGAPLLLVGNGTGIAGLRAHLRARIEAGARRNWLLFGERNRAHDFHFGAELQQWQRDGWIERLDTVFSRDGEAQRYVQDALAAHATLLRQWVDEGASILVCGSLQGMAPAVDAVITEALGQQRKQQLVAEHRYRRDVY